MDTGFGTFGKMTSSIHLRQSEMKSYEGVEPQSMTIGTFFEKMLNLNIQEMENNSPIRVVGYQIKSWDFSRNESIWKNIIHVVRKEDVVPLIVTFGDQKLQVAPEHRFWTKLNKNNFPHWMEAHSMFLSGEDYQLMTVDGWIDVSIKMGIHPIQILDIEVEDTHAYFSNGVLSHNTLYGDPTVTPGGLAIPFHASVRIKLTGGAKIEDPKTKEMIGIELTANIIKNKVARPFRTAAISIVFGKGIREHEQLFDALRAYCDEHVIEKDGRTYKIEGTGGGWKQLSVTDTKTGEIIVDKKFYKPDFEKILSDPQTKPHVDVIVETALVRLNDQSKVQQEENSDEDGYDVEEALPV